MLVHCGRCGAVMGWCGELDYAVGRIDGGELFRFSRGDHADWARKQCPACGGPVESLGHADADTLRAAGLSSRQVMWAAPDGSIREAVPPW
ncbi:MAG: hypothetical protein KGS60_05810 [Verrucomicrobia bacterium]|nr:hypothetical protein [Verrucomicrobiota bacterium]